MRTFVIFGLSLMVGVASMVKVVIANEHPLKVAQRLVQPYPNIAQVKTIGTSRGGQAIPTVVIAEGAPEQKPALWIVGGVDPRLPSSATYCFWLIEDLLKSYANAKSPLRNYTLYITPVAVPDVLLAQKAQPRAPRLTNLRETDDDRDGALNEDGYDDLNGDGYITRMRVFRRSGKYRIAEVDSFLWRKVDAKRGEEGQFDLYWEGFDNDKDDQINEDPPGGVNINQNFTFQYPYFKPGSGPHQISEPESRALADFAFSHPNIVMVVTFSLNDNVVNHWPVMKSDKKGKAKPQGRTSRRRPPLQPEIRQIPLTDAPYFYAFGRLFRELFPEGWAFPGAEHPGGAFDRWAYFHFGRWVVSLPGWLLPPDSAKTPSDKTNQDTPKRLRQVDYYHRLLQFSRENQWQIWVPWQPIEHPDFPGQRVEVGGFYPVVIGNPPKNLLKAYRSNYARLIQRLVALLPRLTVSKPRITPLGSGVYRITFLVQNRGRLPTNTVTGSRLRWMQNVRVRFLLKGQVLESGTKIQLLEPLPPDGLQKITAVVRGKPGSRFTVEVGSPTVGYHTQIIQLP